jgi:hypothetical protein
MTVSKPSFCVAAVTLLALAVTVISLGNGFVSYDDVVLIQGNPHISSDGPGGLIALLVPEPGREYLPVRDISYWLDYRLWGFNPLGYHLTQILLHAIVTGLLVCFLVSHVLPLVGNGHEANGESNDGSPPVMLFVWAAGILFAVHPIHVESVAWVSGRKDLLAAAFSLATLLFYGHSIKRGKQTSYWLSVITTGLAILAKATAVVLPVLLVFASETLWRIDSNRRKNLTRITPHLALAAVGLFLTIRSSLDAGMIQNPHGGGWIAHSFIVCRIFVHSLGNLVLPLRLQLDYNVVTEGVLHSVWSYLAVALTVGLLASLLLWGIKNKVVFWGSTFFLIAYLPTSNLVPFQQHGADRYLYLPSVGFFVLLSYGLFVLWRWLARVRIPTGVRYGLIGVGCLYIVFLSVSTVAHTTVWKDSETLWHHVLRGNPESIPAHGNLGWVYLRAERYEESLPHLVEAIRLAPSNVGARVNLGYGLVKVGKPREAIVVLEDAIGQDPNHVNAHYNLGCAFAAMGDAEKSVLWIRRAESMGLQVGELLKTDPDLDPIRGDEAFEEYLQSQN